jgi:hypothetical protein
MRQLGLEAKEWGAETVVACPLAQFTNCTNAGSEGVTLIIVLVPWTRLVGLSPYCAIPSFV